MGQGTALDALHIKAARADLIQHGSQLPGLVAGGKQQCQPLPFAGQGGRGFAALDHDKPGGVVALGVDARCQHLQAVQLRGFGAGNGGQRGVVLLCHMAGGVRRVAPRLQGKGVLLQKDIALRQRLRVADHGAYLLDFRAGQRHQILPDGQVAHCRHGDLRVGVQKVQHSGNIPRAGIFKGQHAKARIAVLHGVKHLAPCGKGGGAGKGEQLAQGNVAPRALNALIGGGVLPQRGALVRAGNRHCLLQKGAVIGAQLVVLQPRRVFVQHGSLPRGVKHRLAGLRLVAHHVGDRLHTLLKQSSHLGVDLVDLAAGLL